MSVSHLIVHVKRQTEGQINHSGAPYYINIRRGANRHIMWDIGNVLHGGAVAPNLLRLYGGAKQYQKARYLYRRDNQSNATMQPGTVLEKNIWGQCPKNIETPSGERRRPKNRAPSGGSVRKEVPPQPIKGMGECLKLSNEFWGKPRPEMHFGPFWHIFKATECSFLHLYTDVLSSSNSVLCPIWGQGRSLGQLPSLPQH